MLLKPTVQWRSQSYQSITVIVKVHKSISKHDWQSVIPLGIICIYFGIKCTYFVCYFVFSLRQD